MKGHVHQAPVRLFVPEGFWGWWCERCEKAVTLPDELGSPARCPRCHKPTAVWIPPPASAECGAQSAEAERPRLTAKRCKSLFSHMHAVIEDPSLPADYSEWIRQETMR